jgi:Zn-dependent protease
VNETHGWQIRLFSLFGFEVKLDLSWLLLALLISWSLAAGMFPQAYPDLPVTTYAAMGITVAVGVFFSIVLHEFSHSIVARRYGLPIRGITLFIFGGVAEMEREPPSPKAEFFMAAAGPIASFVIAFAFWNLEALAVASGWPTPVVGVLNTMALINLTVAIFNLVPAFPLDGGRILRAALWYRQRDLRAATEICARIGRGFGTALMVLGFLSILMGNLVGGMWWILIGLFVRGAATASVNQQIVTDLFADRPVSDFMVKRPVTVPADISIQDWLDEYVYEYHKKMYPVVAGEELLGSISIADIQALPKAGRAETTVKERMQAVSAANSVDVRTGTNELLQGMLRKTRQPRYMVVDRGRLVGMITLKDLLDLLAIRLEVERGQ